MPPSRVSIAIGAVHSQGNVLPFQSVERRCMRVGNVHAECRAAGGQEISLTRSYGSCPTCGTGLFPLDEELALLPRSSLTPRQQEHLVHLASWMPFEQAAKMLECLLGVQVSEAATRRQTEQAGAHAQAAQTAQAKAQTDSSDKDVARLAVSVDGAYVPLLKGE